MGVVKLPERVAANFSFVLERRSRVESGYWDGLVAPRMGPLRSSSEESSSHPNGGSGVLRLALWWRLARGMRLALSSSNRPTCYPCPFLGGAHYALFEA